MLHRIALSLLVILMTTANVSAARNSGPKQLGKFGHWTSYVMTQNGKKVCYMASHPQKKAGKYTKRGDVYMLVTHRPAEKSFNVVSVHAGYPFSSGATVIATIDKKEFKLFAEGETAWAPNTLDKQVTTALTRGSSLVVKGKSRKGTATRDVYSLKGTTKAWNAINKACGVK